MHKYFLKIFYNKTNKKGYNLLIWQPNIRLINIIVIKNIIILKKTKKKKELLINILKTIVLAKIF